MFSGETFFIDSLYFFALRTNRFLLRRCDVSGGITPTGDLLRINLLAYPFIRVYVYLLTFLFTC